MVIKRLIGVCVLCGCTATSLAQTMAGPHGEGSVVFGSGGGKWQKAMITDMLTEESSTAYSLEAEAAATDVRIERHPRIVFSCEQSDRFDGIRTRTGLDLANQYPGADNSSRRGLAQISTSIDNHKPKIWIAEITRDGSDLLPDKRIISDFLGHKRFVIRFTAATGETITDEYLIDGLSIESIKTDCPAFFANR